MAGVVEGKVEGARGAIGDDGTRRRGQLVEVGLAVEPAADLLTVALELAAGPVGAAAVAVTWKKDTLP